MEKNTENKLKQYEQKTEIEQKIDSKIIKSNEEINLLSNRLKKITKIKKLSLIQYTEHQEMVIHQMIIIINVMEK